jgi:hypothetical protein
MKSPLREGERRGMMGVFSDGPWWKQLLGVLMWVPIWLWEIFKAMTLKLTFGNSEKVYAAHDWNTRPIEDSLRKENKRLREVEKDAVSMAINIGNYTHAEDCMADDDENNCDCSLSVGRKFLKKHKGAGCEGENEKSN